ncbi:MAG: M20/M25/M40 family metallo-hydrolase, partial [Pseudomonadota bacterium]
RGGHAAFPHFAADPIVAASALVQAMQTVVSRTVDPQQPAVLSITEFHAGFAHNVIPDEARLTGTTRSFDDGVQALIEGAMDRIAAGIGAAYGVEIAIERGKNPYPATVNDRAETDFAEAAARDILGDAVVTRGHPPAMVGEDFSFMANRVPGCYLLIGNGATETLHHPGYDFNDAALPAGVALWSGLVERALPRE